MSRALGDGRWLFPEAELHTLSHLDCLHGPQSQVLELPAACEITPCAVMDRQWRSTASTRRIAADVIREPLLMVLRHEGTRLVAHRRCLLVMLQQEDRVREMAMVFPPTAPEAARRVLLQHHVPNMLLHRLREHEPRLTFLPAAAAQPASSTPPLHLTFSGEFGTPLPLVFPIHGFLAFLVHAVTLVEPRAASSSGPLRPPVLRLPGGAAVVPRLESFGWSVRQSAAQREWTEWHVALVCTLGPVEASSAVQAVADARLPCAVAREWAERRWQAWPELGAWHAQCMEYALKLGVADDTWRHELQPLSSLVCQAGRVLAWLNAAPVRQSPVTLLSNRTAISAHVNHDANPTSAVPLLLSEAQLSDERQAGALEVRSRTDTVAYVLSPGALLPGDRK